MSIELLPPTFDSWNPKGSEKQIAALMSGGVDSSVTAMLLKQAGYDVLGITMKIPRAREADGPPPSRSAEAAFICKQLNICHYFLDVAQAFRELVIAPFRKAYSQGFTPCPCVDCNAHLKFGLVWDLIKKTFGIQHLATGHYARLIQHNDRTHLARAEDTTKDQSYFLSAVCSQRLSNLLLPLGQRTKKQVRQLAREHRLEVAERQESMELCFADQSDYRCALGPQAHPQPGPILDQTGKVLGQHQGIFNYTIGQRRGLGVAFTEPLYVSRICPQENSVTLAARDQLHRRDVSISNVNTFLSEEFQPGQRLLGQIRSPGQAASCTVTKIGSETTVRFDTPQFAPCPGQRLVLYDDQNSKVVAGGTII